MTEDIVTTVSFTINNAFVPRIIAALKSAYPDIMTTAPTPSAGAKQVIIQFITQLVAQYEATQKMGDSVNFGQQMQQLQLTYTSNFQAQQQQTTTDCGANIS